MADNKTKLPPHPQPQEKASSIDTIIVLILIIGVLFLIRSCSDDSTDSAPSKADLEWNLRFAAENIIKARLKDPDSAEFSNMRVRDWVVCGRVNAKNSFGGYSGKTRFMSGGKPETTFMEEDMEASDFDYVWQIKCSH